MALKVDYVAKEAAINLRRNLTLTFATVVTVAIALTLVGASTDQVKKQEDSFSKLSTFCLVFAGVVGAVSLILIVNSIRIAMFARRREIEVMKLVGATNWFIRVPFMAEGLVQGFIGALFGIGIVAAVRNWMLPTLVSGGGVWTDFHVNVSDVQGTAIVLVIGG